MVHFLTAERVTDRSLRRSVGSADAQTWDRRPPDLASRGGTPEAPAAPANGSGDASAGELPDVVDVSSPSPARFTVRQALATVAGAIGVALLVPIALLVIGLPLAMAVRGLLELLVRLLSGVF